MYLFTFSIVPQIVLPISHPPASTFLTTSEKKDTHRALPPSPRPSADDVHTVGVVSSHMKLCLYVFMKTLLCTGCAKPMRVFCRKVSPRSH